MTQQGDRQASVRAITGTALTYEGDFMAMFDGAGIAAGDFDGRLLAWINKQLGASYTEINSAMQAYAATFSAANWSSLGSLDPYPGATSALDFVGPSASGLPFYKLNGIVYTALSSIPGWTFTRASAKTALNSAGQVVSFVSGVPATTDLGFLPEESRTNLALWSQDFTNAAWTKLNCSVTANAATAPDGTVTAGKIVEDATSNQHGVTQQPVLVSGTTYVQSVFAKAAERTWLEMTEGNNVSAAAWFNLAAGTIGTVSGTGSPAATIQALGNGWYRCTLRFTPAANVGNVQVRPSTGDNIPSYLGDGVSGIYAWGAQMEAGTFATSYIATTTAAATRAADLAAITGLTAPSAYTLVASATGIAGGANPRLMEFDDGTSNNRAALYSAAGLTGSMVVSSGGVAQADISGGAVTLGQTFAVSGRVDVNNFGVSRNGGAVATDVSGAMPVTPTTLYFGNASSNQPLNGYLRRAILYPTAYADAQLQAASQ